MWKSEKEIQEKTGVVIGQRSLLDIFNELKNRNLLIEGEYEYIPGVKLTVTVETKAPIVFTVGELSWWPQDYTTGSIVGPNSWIAANAYLYPHEEGWRVSFKVGDYYFGYRTLGNL